ncbi:MAG: type II secretion system minor pseudopilin GspK [Burkholderiaceae bacterium]
MRRDSRHERGAAIVSVLVLVSIATLLVASLFWRQHLATRSVQNRFASAQLRWIETAVLDWAAVVLRSDQSSSGQVDHLQETWAVPVAETRLDETVTAGARISGSTRSALIAGQIFDAQGRLNLSNLVHDGKPVEKQAAAFRRLLAFLGLPPELESTLTRRLLESYPAPAAAADQGAGGTTGSAAVPAAGSAAAPAASGSPPTASGSPPTAAPAQRATAPIPLLAPPLKMSELLRLPGFDERVVAALMPFAVLLPKHIPSGDTRHSTASTRVNVNTAPAEVIAALGDDITLDAARGFVLARERVVSTAIEQAGSRFNPPISLNAELFSVGSSFFLVAGMVRFERVEASTEALFFRGPARVDLVWRQQF